MIEALMYFILGTLTAALMCLLVIPAIWRRAVRLTKKQIHSEIPRHYNEIQAEKDQVRAQYAVRTRKLELNINGLQKDKANDRAIINQQNNDLHDLDIDLGASRKEVGELEHSKKALQDQLIVKQEEIAEQTASLRKIERHRADLNEQLHDLQIDLDHMSLLRDEQQISLATQQAQIELLRDQLLDLETEKRALLVAKSATETEALGLKRTIQRQKKQIYKFEEKVATLQGDLADRNEQLERRQKQLERLKDGVPDSFSSGMAERLMDAEAGRVKAEARVADLTFKLDEFGTSRPSNVEAVVRSLTKERDTLAKRIRELEASENNNSSDSKSSQPLSMQDHRMREDIKALATSVANMVTDLEGNKSPIKSLLNANDDTLAGKPNLATQIKSLRSRLEHAAKTPAAGE